MKSVLLSLLFWGSMILMIACNGNKGSVTDGEDHDMNSMEGMDMGRGNATDTSLLSVVAATNELVMSDQYSVPVRITDTIIRIKGYGYITWDVRRNKKIAARTGGRIEKLFVKYNYQYVNKGQKILDLYTPEINTYAAEYLHHVQTPGDEILRVKSKEKLKLLGMTERQIRQLEITGHINNVLSVYSGGSGYALFDARGGNIASGMVSGGATPNMQLREGMYVNRDQTLFYVNDFAIVWGVLSFDENTQPLLRTGMNVVVKSELLSLPVRSTISFIEPTFDNASQKFMQVRTYLPNAGRRLRINSLIEGEVDIPLNRQSIIPAASVFSLGKRKIVWVKTGMTPSGKNIFKARDIQISLIDKHIAVVTAGLSASEEVASNAGYLLDSQSLIEQ